jgi:hypothetical protein
MGHLVSHQDVQRWRATVYSGLEAAETVTTFLKVQQEGISFAGEQTSAVPLYP